MLSQRFLFIKPVPEIANCRTRYRHLLAVVCKVALLRKRDERKQDGIKTLAVSNCRLLTEGTPALQAPLGEESIGSSFAELHPQPCSCILPAHYSQHCHCHSLNIGRASALSNSHLFSIKRIQRNSCVTKHKSPCHFPSPSSHHCTY